MCKVWFNRLLSFSSTLYKKNKILTDVRKFEKNQITWIKAPVRIWLLKQNECNSILVKILRYLKMLGYQKCLARN